jgi:hypothetical protein
MLQIEYLPLFIFLFSEKTLQITHIIEVLPTISVVKLNVFIIVNINKL